MANMKTSEKIKRRTFDIIQVGSKTDLVSNLFDIFIVIIIFVNLAAVIFETYDYSIPYRNVLSVIELVTTTIFAVEYFLRLWTAGYLFPNEKVSVARFKFFISFYGIIDLLSFLPYFMPIIFPTGIVAFRIFRVVRIFRLFRINSQYDAFNIIADVIKEKRNQLFSSMLIIFMLMLASSMIMYSLEHEAQPDLFQNAFSGIWWSVSALLTVGYGDIYPITFTGRFMAIIISFLGVGLVSIPTGIISAGFVEHYSRMTEEKKQDEAALQRARDSINAMNPFITSEINKNHVWVGKKIGEIVLPPGMKLDVIKRDGKMIPVNEETVIKAKDLLILYL